jgi:hypothetical protein
MCRREQEVTTKVQHGADGRKCGCGNAKRLLAAPGAWQRMTKGLEKRLTVSAEAPSYAKTFLHFAGIIFTTNTKGALIVDGLGTLCGLSICKTWTLIRDISVMSQQ